MLWLMSRDFVMCSADRSGRTLEYGASLTVVLHAVLHIDSDSPLGLLLELFHASMQHALTELTLHINELVGSWSGMSLARLHFLQLCTLLSLHQ